MDILKNLNAAREQMESKAKSIFDLVCEISRHHEAELNKQGIDTELIPYTLRRREASFELSDHHESDYNWPNELLTHYAVLTVEEYPDQYEDFGTESYRLRMPYSVALGEEVELAKWLEQHFDSEARRCRTSKNENDFLAIFKLNPDVVRLIADYVEANPVPETATHKEVYDARMSFLKQIGVEVR